MQKCIKHRNIIHKKIKQNNIKHKKTWSTQKIGNTTNSDFGHFSIIMFSQQKVSLFNALKFFLGRTPETTFY